MSEQIVNNDGEYNCLSPTSPTSSDAATQTDIMSEQEVLKDIMDNKDLFFKVAESLPQHYNRLMDIRLQRI
ncbi:hypothetical protein GCK32_018426 [Trichostrongylus colubriformis]|uniref:Uncharacterized protein n=1 Tax=Trichostrongylus colubriformis TaxID=6319 RepID=A0AAN8F0K1_TRICO